jgi:hypothetical protein
MFPLEFSRKSSAARQTFLDNLLSRIVDIYLTLFVWRIKVYVATKIRSFYLTHPDHQQIGWVELKKCRCLRSKSWNWSSLTTFRKKLDKNSIVFAFNLSSEARHLQLSFPHKISESNCLTQRRPTQMRPRAAFSKKRLMKGQIFRKFQWFCWFFSKRTISRETLRAAKKSFKGRGLADAGLTVQINYWELVGIDSYDKNLVSVCTVSWNNLDFLHRWIILLLHNVKRFCYGKIY